MSTITRIISNNKQYNKSNKSTIEISDDVDWIDIESISNMSTMSTMSTTNNNKNNNDDNDNDSDSDNSSDINNVEKTKTITNTKTNTKKSKNNTKVNTQNKKSKTRITTIVHLNNDETKPITAGGVLFYKNVDGKLMLLIIETKGKFEDIGGKIDPNDEDIYHAVAREVQEETNKQILANNIIERLQKAPYVYVPRSKYVIYLVEASVNEKKLKRNDFGDEESHTKASRTIGWISREELTKPATIQSKMNWRLKTKVLFEKLNDIEKNSKFKKKIFKSVFKSIKPKVSDHSYDSDNDDGQ